MKHFLGYILIHYSKIDKSFEYAYIDGTWKLILVFPIGKNPTF